MKPHDPIIPPIGADGAGDRWRSIVSGVGDR
jgi:hypothetical protein